MDNHDKRPPPVSDAALIDADTIQTALQNRANDSTPDSPFEILRTEPILSSFVHGELLQLVGKLALSGAGTDVVRGVSTDVHRLLGITAAAFRLAYCGLLEDFMPEEQPEKPDGVPDDTRPPGNEGTQTDGDAGVPF
jgi:hypothetical protein